MNPFLAVLLVMLALLAIDIWLCARVRERNRKASEALNQRQRIGL